jgi:hypothetical protein
MGTLLKQIYPIARKEHQCYFCGGIINKGEKYSRQSVENDGSVDDITTHINCNNLAEKLKMYEGFYGDYDEGLSSDGFAECIFDYVREHHKDPELKFGTLPEWDLPFDELVKKVYNEVINNN